MAMVQIAPPNSGIVPPQVQAQQALDVGQDYVTKKRIADALRKRTDAMQKGYKPASNTIETAGNDYHMGTVDVNYGGILQNALMPWLQSRQDDKALAAEDEAKAARMAVLGQLTGKETPQELVQIGEKIGSPELSKAGYAKMLPEEMNAAAQAQASTTVGGIDAMVTMKVITPEEGAVRKKALRDAELQAIQDKKDFYKYQQDNKSYDPRSGGGGGSGSTSGKQELTPGLLQLYGKTLSDVKDQYGAAVSTRRALNAMRPLIYGTGADGKPDPGKSALSPMTALLSHGSDAGLPLLQYAQNAPARELDVLINQQILGEASKLKGSLSDKDLAFLQKSLLSLKDNPKSAAAIYEGVVARMEGVEDRLLASRKGIVDMDDRLEGFWLDPTTGESVAEPTVNTTGAPEAVPPGIAAPAAGWAPKGDGGDGYEYRVVDGKTQRRKVGG